MNTADILNITTMGYRLADYAVKYPEIEISPWFRELVARGRVSQTNSLKTGFQVWDDAFPVSQTMTNFDATATLKEIDEHSTATYAQEGLMQGFKFTETEYQLLVNLIGQYKKVSKDSKDKKNYVVDPTVGDGLLRKVLNRAMRQMYLDAEACLVRGTKSDASASDIRGLIDVVTTTGPSAAFGGLNLSTLSIAEERPWYVVGSGGTGSVAKYGYTFTGSATIGRAEFLRWVEQIINASKLRGVKMTHLVMNPADLSLWRAAVAPALSARTDMDASTMKKFDSMNPAQKGYMIGSNVTLDFNGLIPVQSPYAAAGYAWLVDIEQVEVQRVRPAYAKNYMKYENDKTALFDIIFDKVQTSATGIGKGYVGQIESMFQFVPTRPAAVAFINYSASTA